MKKSNKTILIIMIVIVFLSLLFFFTIGRKLIKNSKINDMIIVGNDAVFKKDGNKWRNVPFKDISKYNWKQYYTYIDNSYFGQYYLYNSEKWYLFEDKNKALNYEGDLLALSGNIKYKVVNFTLHDIEDTTYVKQVLKDHHLDENSTLTSSSYVDIDINNDGNKERIYTISNQFPLEDVGNTYFSFIFMIDHNRIIYLYEKVKEEVDPYSGCKPYINNIIDVDEDDRYEIILGCGYYSTNGIHYKMYQFKNGKFNLLVSN